jgi:Tol biopolymer transport system component
MAGLRALTVCTVLALSGCTSFATAVLCPEPPLITVWGDPLEGSTTMQLWATNGSSDVLTSDPGAHAPAVSPDGSAVAFVLADGPWSDSTGFDTGRVALLRVGGRDVRLLSADLPGTAVDGLQWSADGQRVAFVRRGADGDEIVAVDVDDGQERRLLGLTEGQGVFAWSPDGRELLVPTSFPDVPGEPSGSRPTELRRYLVASGYHVVVPTPHALIGQIAWSPDGRLVAMAANIPGTPRMRLFALDLETGDSRPVDRRAGFVWDMTWSGHHLVYLYRLADPFDVRVPMTWDSRTGERGAIERPGADRFGNSPLASVSAAACDS